MNPGLKVIYLTKIDLRGALNENTYWQQERILIPKSKANWLLQNNRIQEDDYCAIVCLEQTKIISYVLIIPDEIQLKNKTLHKVNWLHEWWVDDKYAGSIVSSYIFNQTVKKLNKNILIESNAENAELFFNTQFKTIFSKTRHTIFFLLHSDIIIGKFPFLRYFKFLIEIANRTLVKVITIFNYKKTQKSLANISYEYINKLDKDVWKFMALRCRNDFTLKTEEYVNWHIDNSQYLQTPVNKRFNFKFSTTGFSDNIHEHSFKIIKDSQIIGFISYLFNMIEFNVKYFIPKDDEHYKFCLDALVEHCLKAKATYIITDDIRLNNEINKKYKTLFTYKQNKTSKAHKSLDLDFKDIVLTDRDGRFH